MDGLLWGNSAVDLGDMEIGLMEKGTAYSVPSRYSQSYSVSACWIGKKVHVGVRDNSCGMDNHDCATGSMVLCS